MARAHPVKKKWIRFSTSTDFKEQFVFPFEGGKTEEESQILKE